MPYSLAFNPGAKYSTTLGTTLYEIEIILIKASFPFAVIPKLNWVFTQCKYTYANNV